MANLKKSSKKTGIGYRIAKKIESLDKKAIVGLILLIASYIMGIILRNSAYITNTSIRRLATCDTYISWLCVPTVYFSIPLGALGWLVINLTSFLVSVTLFILGVLLLRSRRPNAKSRI